MHDDIAAPKLHRAKRTSNFAPQELSTSNIKPLNQCCQELIIKTMKIEKLSRIILPFLKAYEKVYSETIDTDAPRIVWGILRQGGLFCELANLKTSGCIKSYNDATADLSGQDFEERVCLSDKAISNLSLFLNVCIETHFKTEGELFTINDFMDKTNSNNQLRIALNLAFWYLEGFDSSQIIQNDVDSTNPLLKIYKRITLEESLASINVGVGDCDGDCDGNHGNHSHHKMVDKTKNTRMTITAPEKHRLMAQQEFFNTETQYVADLEELQNYSKEVHLSKTLTKKEQKLVFANLDELIDFQITFHLGMEKMFRDTEFSIEKATNCDFSSFFIKNLIRFSTIYPTFLLNIQSSRTFFSGSSGSRLDRHNNRMDRHTTLGAYMIKPMQRIPRYQMLLKEMIKATKEISDERLLASLEGAGATDTGKDYLKLDLPSLTDAYLHSTFFTLWINERQRIQDYQNIRKGIFRDWKNAGDGDGELLLFSIMKDCIVFLFEKIIIISEALPPETQQLITPEMKSFPILKEERRIGIDKIGNVEIIEGSTSSILVRNIDSTPDLIIIPEKKNLFIWLATIKAIITMIWESELGSAGVGDDIGRSSRRLSCKIVENILILKKDPILDKIEIRQDLIDSLIDCDYGNMYGGAGGAGGAGGESNGESTSSLSSSLSSLNLTLSPPCSVSIPNSPEEEKKIIRLKIKTDEKNYLMALESDVCMSLDGIRGAVVWKLRDLYDSSSFNGGGGGEKKEKSQSIGVGEAFSMYKNSLIKKKKGIMLLSVIDEDGDEIEVIDDSDLSLLLMNRPSKMVVRVRFFYQ